MFQPRLGVSLVTIPHEPPGELTDEVIEALAESRVATVEVSPGLFDGDRAGARRSSLKEMLRRSGIRAATVHARSGDLSALDEGAREAAVARATSSLDLAVEFGSPILICHASGEPVEPELRGERLKQARRSLSRIGERCRGAGKRLAVELLPRSCLGNTVEELGELIDSLDDETFGVCLDVNHLMDRYRNLADDIRRLGGRLIALHLSDYDGVDEKHELPGKGVIEWASLMQALRDIGYGGPFTYECHPEGRSARERIRSLEENFEWLSRL